MNGFNLTLSQWVGGVSSDNLPKIMTLKYDISRTLRLIKVGMGFFSIFKVFHLHPTCFEAGMSH